MREPQAGLCGGGSGLRERGRKLLGQVGALPGKQPPATHLSAKVRAGRYLHRPGPNAHSPERASLPQPLGIRLLSWPRRASPRPYQHTS